MIIWIRLANANYTVGYFFNLAMECTNLIAGNGEQITIQLGLEGEVYQATINRTANLNGTPRIMAGTRYRNWVQENFVLGDNLKIKIVSPTFLIIYKKGELHQ